MIVLAQLLQKLVPLFAVADETANGDPGDVIAPEGRERLAVAMRGSQGNGSYNGRDPHHAPKR
jgi:hypothetical protein